MIGQVPHPRRFRAMRICSHSLCGPLNGVHHTNAIAPNPPQLEGSVNFGYPSCGVGSNCNSSTGQMQEGQRRRSHVCRISSLEECVQRRRLAFRTRRMSVGAKNYSAPTRQPCTQSPSSFRVKQSATLKIKHFEQQQQHNTTFDKRFNLNHHRLTVR